MSGDGALQVLVVCAANQCRSRAAEVLLGGALADVAGVAISSAGVLVEAPLPMCAKAERFVMHHGSDPAGVSRRPARMASPHLLADADLILVADRSVRAGVVALDPTARPKTFSLRGAGAAAQYVIDHDLVTRARKAHAAGERSVAEMVDGEEVVVCLALGSGTSEATAWLRAELEVAQGHAAPRGGHDIADAHTSLRARHSQTLTEVLDATRSLSQLLRTLHESATTLT